MHKSRTSKDKRLHVAYHEAGHAVALFLLGEIFHSISLQSDGNSMGRVLYQPFESLVFMKPADPLDPPVLARSVDGFTKCCANRDIFITLAGCAAEAKYLGRAKWFSDFMKYTSSYSDITSAYSFAKMVTSSPDEADAFVSRVAKWADKLFTYPCVWQVTTKLAEALPPGGTMMGEQAVQVIGANWHHQAFPPLTRLGDTWSTRFFYRSR